MQIKMLKITSIVLFLFQVIAPQNASADGDGKMISSGICQAMTPNGADYLVHNGSSLLADGANVTVICPIVKDSIGKRLSWVNIRHKRPANSGGETASGRVYSCDSTYGGCSQSALRTTDTSNNFTSVFVETSNLPHSSDQYFYYRSVLPNGWKIVSVEYKED